MSLSLSIAVRVDFFYCHGANFCHNSLMPCLLHQSFIVEIHNHWELLMDHGKSIIFQNNRDLYNKFFKIVLLSIDSRNKIALMDILNSNFTTIKALLANLFLVLSQD